MTGSHDGATGAWEVEVTGAVPGSTIYVRTDGLDVALAVDHGQRHLTEPETKASGRVSSNMGLQYQASTNTKQVAALTAVGVPLLPPEQLDGGDPVARFFTDANPYDPKAPDGGGELQWLLDCRSSQGVPTESLMEAWEKSEEAANELDSFVDSLEPDIRAILHRMIPRAMVAAARAAMYNWTDLATAAKKARHMVAFAHGNRTAICPADYSEGVAQKFGLPWPNNYRKGGARR